MEKVDRTYRMGKTVSHISDPGLFAAYVKSSVIAQLKRDGPIIIWTTHTHRLLSKEYLFSKLMNKCPMSLIIKELQIKTIVRHSDLYL